MRKRPFDKVNMEYRHYNLPVKFPIIALLENKFKFPIDLCEEVTYMHLHNCMEIGYCYSGKGTFYVEGKELEFAPNDISIVCPYAMHISKNKREGFEDSSSKWEYLYFDPKSLLKNFFPNGFPKSELFMHDFNNFPNIISGKKYPEVANLVLAILNELRFEKENYSTAVRGFVLALMIALSRIIPSTQEEYSPQHEESLVILPAIEYIHKYYMKSIAPQELAELCHMSITHFRRIFKKIMGHSPLEYIRCIRVRQACELLYTSEISILDISLKVGFESISSFNRNFVEIIGKPPTKWRNSTRLIKKDKMKHSEFELNLY